MRFGLVGLGLGSGGGVTPLQRALATVPGADLGLWFDNEYGAGGLYYSESSIKTFADVIADGPAGEPTSAGMLVDGSDAPTLVQGYGPELIVGGGFDAASDLDNFTTGFSSGDGSAGSISVSGGELILITQDVATGEPFIRQTLSDLVVGATYFVSLDVTHAGSSGNWMRASFDSVNGPYTIGVDPGPSPNTGVFTGSFVATSTSHTVFVKVAGARSASTEMRISSLSINQVLPLPGWRTEDRLGEELFDAATMFTNDATVTIDGSTIVFDGSPLGGDVGGFTSSEIVVGRTFELTYTVSDLIGTIRADFRDADGDVTGGTTRSANGTYTERVTTASGGPGTILNAVTFKGISLPLSATVSNISVKQVHNDHTVEVRWNANDVTGDAYGPDLVTNGAFATADDWTFPGAWSHGTNEAVRTASGSDFTLTQAATHLIGKAIYNVTFDVTARTAGGVKPRIIGDTTVEGTSRTAVGTYSEYLVCPENPLTYGAFADALFAGAVSNIKIELVGRVLWCARKDADNYLILYFIDGILRFESVVAGVSEGYVGVAGIDDGGSHSAVLYVDTVAGTLSLNVDSQGLEGPELIANGSFDTDINNWSNPAEERSTQTWETGRLKINATGGNGIAPPTHQDNVQILADVAYAIDWEASTDDGATTSGYIIGTVSKSTAFGMGANNDVFVSTTATTSLLFYGQGLKTVYLDNVSLKATYARTGLTLPTDLTEIHLGHSGGANQLNGYLLEVAAANGNQAWT
ncbi:hypothetical protein QMT40_001795 [Parvibaculaceae bacterium PLY_AMNH_Bact1]|nr:hypothetical protein QMT40_001795 [Parvibaculaceae bacterium PLY_AMNH_Bact1]